MKLCFTHCEEERRWAGKNWPYPQGLRLFPLPLRYSCVAVAPTTASSLCLAGDRKSLATRLERILEMGSSSASNCKTKPVQLSNYFLRLSCRLLLKPSKSNSESALTICGN